MEEEAETQLTDLLSSLSLENKYRRSQTHLYDSISHSRKVDSWSTAATTATKLLAN